MNKNYIFIALVLIVVAIGAFLFLGKKNTSQTENLSMANPASVFCKEHGGVSEIQKNEAGEHANCTFPNGQKCEEWSLFRGECAVDGVVHLSNYSDGKNQIAVAFFIKENTAILNAEYLNFKNLFMNSAESGSGTRYVSQDGEVEFWEHQGEATVSQKDKKLFSGKSITTKVTCTTDGKTYHEGDMVNHIEGQGILADAHYVCKNGSWTIVGDGSEGVKLVP